MREKLQRVLGSGQFLVISYLAQCVIPNDFTGRPMHLEKVKKGNFKIRPQKLGHSEIGTVSQN
jgi:hypothetical protein